MVIAENDNYKKVIEDANMQYRKLETTMGIRASFYFASYMYKQENAYCTDFL